MRWVLIGIVRLYRLFPDGPKRLCLFRETCSLFVLRAAREEGFIGGCRAIRHRFARCRPKYSVHYRYQSSDWEIEFANGEKAGSAELADFVLEPYQTVFNPVLQKQAGR